MTTVQGDPALVAACGVYCGECPKYKQGKCAGCASNDKATWCKVRTCCQANGYATCAACTQFADVRECGKFNNFFARLFGFFHRSDRPANIVRIREIGVAAYADEMAAKGQMTTRRKRLF